jgi:FkbM family methyltransferase
LSRTEALRRFVLDRILARLARRHRAAGLPTLAVVSSEHIGRTVTIEGLYEKELLLALCGPVLSRLIPEANLCAAIDVGANVGNHTMYFARFFRSVIAFEPNPPVACILRANVLLNDLASRVRVVELGLSDAAAELPFAVNASNLGGSRFVEQRVTGMPLISVSRGDDALSGLEISDRIGLIKLDVEGMELPAIEGLINTISRDHPLIVFEANSAEQCGRIRDRLDPAGYRWFYSLQSERPEGWNTWYGRVYGVVRGDAVRIEEIERFESRHYPMIIASTRPYRA